MPVRVADVVVKPSVTINVADALVVDTVGAKCTATVQEMPGSGNMPVHLLLDTEN
jgi:hypothetical protein